MDNSWEQQRQKVLGKSYTPPIQSSQNQSQGVNTSWQTMRQKILKIPSQQSLQKKQVQPPKPQSNILQDVESGIGGFLQDVEKAGVAIPGAIKSFIQDLPNQLGGNYIKDIQKQGQQKTPQTQKSAMEKTLSDIPILGGVIKNGMDYISQTAKYAKADIAGAQYQQQQNKSLQRQQQISQLIAQQNKTTDPKKKAQLRKQALDLMHISPPAQKMMPKNLPTPLQYLGTAVETGLNIGTLGFGGEAATSEELGKSFFSKLLNKKVIASSAAVGGLYGAAQALQDGKTNVTDILTSEGAGAIEFPLLDVGSGIAGKAVNKVITNFTKKGIESLIGSKTQEEAITKIDKVIGTGLANSNKNPAVTEAITTSLKNDIKGIEDKTNDPEIGKYVTYVKNKIDELEGKTQETLPQETTNGTTVTSSEGAYQYFANNQDQAKSDYFSRVKQEFGTENVISADDAKQIIPGFEAKNSGDFHDASSQFVKKIYDEKLQSNKGQGNNTVLFMSGGTGSGKTTAIKNALGTSIEDYPIIYDSNLTGINSSSSKIQKALDNGYKVRVAYVQRDPVTAFEKGVIPRTRTEGRIVPINEHVTRHTEALSTLEQLKQKYGNQLEVAYIDNTGEAGTAKLSSLDSLPKFNYNKDELTKTLNEKLQQAIDNGTIKSDEATAIREGMGTSTSGQSKQEPQKESINTNSTTQNTSKPFKTSKLATGVEQKAVKNKLTDSFGGLPEYKTTNWDKEAKNATTLLENNPARAKSIAMGLELPTKEDDVLPESVFTAIENKATKENDVNTLQELATASNLTTNASYMGQRIGVLSQRDPYSPVKILQKVNKFKAKQVIKKLAGKTINQAIEATTNTIKKEIKKTAPKKEDWLNFIDSIQC